MQAQLYERLLEGCRLDRSPTVSFSHRAGEALEHRASLDAVTKAQRAAPEPRGTSDLAPNRCDEGQVANIRTPLQCVLLAMVDLQWLPSGGRYP